MGDSWGPGARNALLIVGDFFQQATKAKLVDAKARFSAPHDTSEPDPMVLARMMELVNGAAQPAVAQPAFVSPAVEQAPAMPAQPAMPNEPIIVLAPPPAGGMYGTVPAPAPAPITPDGGIRILRAY
jgi:penicillin-binding protein 1A